MTLRATGKGASYRVLVEDARSRPVPGAFVAAWREADRNHPPAYGRTDAEGIVAVEGLLPGPVRVVAVANGQGVARSVVERRAEARIEAPTVARTRRGGPLQTVRLTMRRGGAIRGRIAGFLQPQTFFFLAEVEQRLNRPVE